MKKRKSIYAFIDSQNLFLGIKEQGWLLDFAKFRVYLAEKFGVKKAFLFLGYLPGNERLYSFLKRSGYILVFKPTIKVKGRAGFRIKGNIDAELVLQAMIEYPNYDKAILVSGDGDFYCLAKYLRQKNKLLRIIIPNRKKYSKLLLPFRRWMFFLTAEFKKKLGRTPK